jgi:hypothetical protein
MATATHSSHKRLLISKANAQIILFTSGACFIVIFSLVASYILFGQLNYQNRVIGKKKTALTQLHKDIDNTQELVTQYKTFVGSTQNVLAGDPNGTGGHDGDNAKIVLDALPSKYDFPALATSLEKLITDQGGVIEDIGGIDDEIAQTDSSAAAPAPVEVPFQVSVSGNYETVKKIVDVFQRSIRPIKVQTLEITGGENDMTLKISAVTYYQPEKSLNIRTEVVK